MKRTFEKKTATGDEAIEAGFRSVRVGPKGHRTNAKRRNIVPLEEVFFDGDDGKRLGVESFKSSRKK